MFKAFDHPIVKRAFQYVDLARGESCTDSELAAIVEFAMWLCGQMEMPNIDENVVNFPVERRKQKSGTKSYGNEF